MFKQERDRKTQDVWVASVQSGDLKSVQNLLSQKVMREINAPISNLGLTLLHLSAIFNQVEIAAWLLENKAKIDKKESTSGKTALHMAAYYGHRDILELLLKHSEELPDSKTFVEDKAKCRPIHYSCMHENRRATELLLKYGDEPNALSRIGTPLDIAIRKKNLQLADFLSSNVGIACLQSAFLSPEYEDYLGIRNNMSPVHLAAVTGQKEIAEMLLRKFPQFPSYYLKRDWKLQQLLPILEKDQLLRFLYTTEEIPQVIESVREYVKNMKSTYSSEIFQAIMDLDLNRAKKAVQQEGYEMLTTQTIPPSLTPFELAELVCFTAFFDWLIEKKLIPDFSFQTSFFTRWYFMEADRDAGKREINPSFLV